MTVLATWIDEMAAWEAGAVSVPEPKRGGTWLYCRHSWRETGSGGTVTHYSCLFRTKRRKTYRRHWRRRHREQV